MLSNIPADLRTLDQWVCATGALLPDGKRDKQPRNPRTGHPADVTDPSSWGTFQDACRCGYPFIGFVLTKDDPYTIIDLDDPETPEQTERHNAIVRTFDTYTELSQSGKGLHIIVKGKVPKGVRRDKVEVYSAERYMICTGNVFKNMPVADYQHVLAQMFEQMDTVVPSVELVQVAGTLSDEEVYTMAARAANAAKFAQLWAGNWRGEPEWPSQSEADFALLAMLTFYTKDNEQVRRLFRYSELGKRDKAVRNDRYLNYALAKLRAKEPAPIDFSKLASNAPTRTEDQNQTAHPVTPTERPAPNPPCAEGTRLGSAVPVCPTGARGRTASARKLSYPPGFIGRLAEYFHSSAIRPVPEISLATAIALTAGVVGRAYNISGTGLNQYIILLAKTGSGKEGVGTGIDAMVQAVKMQCPMADEFIGPSAFASGQALIRVLDKQPCFVSVLGEIGLTIQEMCSPNASTAQLVLKKVLLDIYAKSGFSKVLRSSVYSEAEKNTRIVQAPNVTILGESTPESFYDNLDANSIAQGLIPRFLIFDYTGPRPPRNPHAFAPPPKALVDEFATLLSAALGSSQQRTHCPVPMDADAMAFMDTFDALCDSKINGAQQDVAMQLWNRAHLKALKLAALVAVGINPHAPCVNKECAEWAVQVTEQDIAKILRQFSSGNVGTGDTRMEADLRRVVDNYMHMPAKTRQDYKVPSTLKELPVVPLSYLRRCCRPLASFRNDRRGANAALAAILKAMVEAGELNMVPPAQAVQQFATTVPLYVIGTSWQNE